MLPYSKVAMPIHLDPNSLVTSPVCTTAGQHTVPGDSDMDSSALPQVVMGSTFTLCCTAAPPLPLCLESTLHPTGCRLLRTHGHGQMGTGLLPSPAALEGEFPTLPGPRGACPDPASSWSHSAPHVLVGVPWGHGHWVHMSPPPPRAGRETGACPHAGGRNGSLALLWNCASTAVLMDSWTESWVTGVLLGVTSAGGNPCCGCLRGFALRGLQAIGERIRCHGVVFRLIHQQDTYHSIVWNPAIPSSSPREKTGNPLDQRETSLVRVLYEPRLRKRVEISLFPLQSSLSLGFRVEGWGSGTLLSGLSPYNLSSQQHSGAVMLGPRR